MSHANATLTPAGRLRLARLVVDKRWSYARAAERFSVSVTTARRWATRYLELGKAGMHDRSSRPQRCPNQLPQRIDRRSECLGHDAGHSLCRRFRYFLAAQLGLALLAKPSGVAVFWPASGVAAGILVAAGRRAGVALVVGVVVGTVAANLMSDRNLLTSVLNGFCNAGEAVLMAWLLDRWFGRPFTLAISVAS